MNKQEQKLYDAMAGNVDAFDAQLGQGVGNPEFKATFDLQLFTEYFTVDGSNVATKITPAALDAGLKNKLPFLLFGQSDYASGYDKLIKQFSINANWTFQAPFVVGKDTPSVVLDATASASLQKGDLVLPFTSPLPGGGDTTLALNVIHCSDVAYGSLLSATSSDTFILDGIRYVIDDPVNNVGQYKNAINLYELSLFGKFSSDSFVPNQFKRADQFQDGIVDLPITQGIDKHRSLAFSNNFDNENQSMSIFVRSLNKVSAAIQSPIS